MPSILRARHRVHVSVRSTPLCLQLSCPGRGHDVTNRRDCCCLRCHRVLCRARYGWGPIPMLSAVDTARTHPFASPCVQATALIHRSTPGRRYRYGKSTVRAEVRCVLYFHFTLQYHKVLQHAVSFFVTSHFSKHTAKHAVPFFSLHTSVSRSSAACGVLYSSSQHFSMTCR